MHRPVPPPSLPELMAETRPSPESMLEMLTLLKINGSDVAPGGRYRHWDKLRHLKPPEGLSHREWWLAIKLARMSLSRALPLLDKQQTPFCYGLPDIALGMLHDIDKRSSGAIAAPEQVIDAQTRDTVLVRSLMEEAITSSQLEGATTTRKVAKEMLQTGRPPRDRNERMILNNYNAVRLIRTWTDVPLSLDLLLELHHALTVETLRDPSAAGRLRTSSDDVVVEDKTGTVLHMPPDAAELDKRIERLCSFANRADSEPTFMHPVIKAIVLHFWLAYDHPFVDGNGRTARALFYWSVARDGYWLLEFTSISRILKSAPSKYARAFLYTESDDNDLTYFLLHQLQAINRAIDGLYEYLRRKAHDVMQTRRILEPSGALGRTLNHRQLALLHHALRHPDHTYTIRSHRRSHDVSYQTARTDLLGLTALTLLDQSRVGRLFVFDVPADLRQRLENARFTRPRTREQRD